MVHSRFNFLSYMVTLGTNSRPPKSDNSSAIPFLQIVISNQDRIHLCDRQKECRQFKRGYEVTFTIGLRALNLKNLLVFPFIVCLNPWITSRETLQISIFKVEIWCLKWNCNLENKVKVIEHFQFYLYYSDASMQVWSEFTNWFINTPYKKEKATQTVHGTPPLLATRPNF